MTSSKPTVLLHTCCAPCLVVPFRILSKDRLVTVFFANPNIDSAEEYDLRKQEVTRWAAEEGICLIVAEENRLAWQEAIRGTEDEPEGGLRCERCYRNRLETTAREAQRRGFDCFGTTLSISPHKKAEVINRIGEEISQTTGVRFFEADFKKGGGFSESCRISREKNFYRQNFCGCVFSRRGGSSNLKGEA
jgi:predicted adenine nucleotide alpha hydrolase (AANH) superfamily ATPase